MNYIVLDLEFNQDFTSLQHFDSKSKHFPFEIIQIGAIKLDTSLNTIDTFNRYVKPYFYKNVCPFITSLTGITLSKLLKEAPFPEIYHSFISFTGGTDAIFCTWGMSDIKELFKNTSYHKLSNQYLSRHFINLQPLVSVHLGLPSKKSLRLEHAVSALHIPINHDFHDAINDAYYTSEIFKKIYNTSICPSYYDPTYRLPRPTQPKKQMDTQALLNQFNKMYSRSLTKEEQEMIILAYKMGKTHQFLK